ncbi:MAG: hypothetical protein A07HB70_00480 [uncultured archaeon A07HB70]|jgi:hypothetical protein|nr:MAG: hypothetical protein A07HB70_00480 [uncultured archaeon A07HB70]
MDRDVDVEPDAGEEPIVSAHQTSPERTVFTEKGNCDGWIASDLVVGLDR